MNPIISRRILIVSRNIYKCTHCNVVSTISLILLYCYLMNGGNEGAKEASLPLYTHTYLYKSRYVTFLYCLTIIYHCSVNAMNDKVQFTQTKNMHWKFNRAHKSAPTNRCAPLKWWIMKFSAVTKYEKV